MTAEVRINLPVADPDQFSERAIAVGHGHGAPSIAGRLIARRGLGGRRVRLARALACVSLATAFR
jgi:hypothetical protein